MNPNDNADAGENANLGNNAGSGDEDSRDENAPEMPFGAKEVADTSAADKHAMLSEVHGMPPEKKKLALSAIAQLRAAMKDLRKLGVGFESIAELAQAGLFPKTVVSLKSEPPEKVESFANPEPSARPVPSEGAIKGFVRYAAKYPPLVNYILKVLLRNEEALSSYNKVADQFKSDPEVVSAIVDLAQLVTQLRWPKNKAPVLPQNQEENGAQKLLAKRLWYFVVLWWNQEIEPPIDELPRVLNDPGLVFEHLNSLRKRTSPTTQT